MVETNVPAISIIVAVYNAEKTLRRCLDSLVSQTFHSLEFILVDDGSTDGSWSICQEYAHADHRFKCFHKENEGVSATRQYGLDRATGTYVIHLDSDDYVDKRIYQEMYEEAVRKNADVVFVDILRIEGNQQATLLRNRLSSWTHRNVLDAMIYKLFGSLCNRLVRRSLFEQYDIHFPERMQYLEDKLILIKLLSRSFNSGHYLKFGYVPKAYLYYDTTANANSLTKVSDKDKFFFRYSYWKQAGEELDIGTFGKTYYNLLVEYGFNVLWNHKLPKEQFVAFFSPQQSKIQQYASPGSRKYLVLLAADGHYDKVEARRWLAYPLLLRDKLRIYWNGIAARYTRERHL